MIPSTVISSVAALMNDIAQEEYTDNNCLPYFNIALADCQEIFQLNDIPSTHEVSTVIDVAAGVTNIGFSTTPALPSNLVEIKNVWERLSETNPYSWVKRLEFLPLSWEGITVNSFGAFAFVDQELHFPESVQDNQIKLDYLKDIFSPVDANDVDIDIPIIRAQSYIQYRTAALCAFFIGENSERAGVLQSEAEKALDRSIGISTKGRQNIRTRRQPFRAAFKRVNYFGP